ncbi:pheromone-like peptide [Fomitiporia mediterranea MF3/22]|uniref:pheromone-like peptide n=1 Tax=Fomitiporia mediterranea (strain MF3/22) TaxID=694068 RepID=UPI0004408D1E|nr:pheromone-like peptide [Fomitiporia mediterranea MF3/22]EJD05170.1 pheromone-like peptide [Fomitiporia mediterranea MF3/22]
MDTFTTISIISTTSSESSTSIPVSNETSNSSRTYCFIANQPEAEAPMDEERSNSSGTYCVIV